MNYAQRVTWAELIASTIGAAVYFAIVLPQLGARPVDEIDWQQPMIWTCVGAIGLSIVLSIGWGIIAGMIDRDEQHVADRRDREIGWYGNRLGQVFAAVGGVAALVLTMLEMQWFWIGNVLFLGFFLATAGGGVAQLVAYRRGLP